MATWAAVDSAGSPVVTSATDANTGPLTEVLYEWMTTKVDANGTPLCASNDGASDTEGSHGIVPGAIDGTYVNRENRAHATDPSGTFMLPTAMIMKYGHHGVQGWTRGVCATSGRWEASIPMTASMFEFDQRSACQHSRDTCTREH